MSSYTPNTSLFFLPKILSTYHKATPTNYFIRHILFVKHKIYIDNLCCMIVWYIHVVLWWVHTCFMFVYILYACNIEKQSWVSCGNTPKSLWMNCLCKIASKARCESLCAWISHKINLTIYMSNTVDSRYNKLLGPSENTVEPHYNEVLGTTTITLLYQVSHYIRVKKRNVKSWDHQNYLVIRGFYYIRPLYNEVPFY